MTLPNDENFFANGADRLVRGLLELQYQDALPDRSEIQSLPPEFFEEMRRKAENLSDEEKAHLDAVVVNCWNNITEILPQIIEAEQNHSGGT